jgi:hypothetical protein
MATRQTYRIAAPVEREGEKTRWVSIGWGNLIDGGKIVCTLEAIPLGWDDKFYLFEHSKDEPPY